MWREGIQEHWDGKEEENGPGEKLLLGNNEEQRRLKKEMKAGK